MTDETKTALRTALKHLLNEVDRNTCVHDDTYRGGMIWTICRGCGRKWADDEGGFAPHEDSAAIKAAREILDANDVEESFADYYITIGERSCKIVDLPRDELVRQLAFCIDRVEAIDGFSERLVAEVQAFRQGRGS